MKEARIAAPTPEKKDKQAVTVVSPEMQGEAAVAALTAFFTQCKNQYGSVQDSIWTPRLINFARKYTYQLDPEAAHDAILEAYLQCKNQVDQAVQSGDNLPKITSTYIFSIIRNKLVEWSRKEGKFIAETNIDQLLETVGHVESPSEVCLYYCALDEVVEKFGDNHEYLQILLWQLSGYSLPEITEYMRSKLRNPGITYKAIESRRNRVNGMVKKLMATQGMLNPFTA